MGKVFLPDIGTPEWEKLAKDYRKSTRKWRNKTAKDLGFINRSSFQSAMGHRDVGLSDGEQEQEDILQTTPDITSDFKLPPDSTLEEHIEAIKAIDKLVAYHQRLPQEVTINIATQLPIGIIESADWQLGQFGVDYDSWQSYIETVVNEPGVFTNVGGDGIYNIIQASKMGSSHNQIPISVQKGLYVLAIKKMRRKILTLKLGNHEYFDNLLTGEDWLGEKAKHLKLIYIKFGGRINYKVGDFVYSEFTIHKGRYQSTFNQTHSNKQYQRLHAPWARIIDVEHNHIGDVETYQYDGRDCVAIRPGTFAVYDDYALANGFYGAHVCNPIIILFPDRDCVVAFKDLSEGIRYLRAVRESYIES